MVVSITKSFHCTVVGDGLVGKSCLVERFLGGDFTNEYVATLQDDYTTKCNLNGDNLNMNITDIAGEVSSLTFIHVLNEAFALKIIPNICCIQKLHISSFYFTARRLGFPWCSGCLYRLLQSRGQRLHGERAQLLGSQDTFSKQTHSYCPHRDSVRQATSPQEMSYFYWGGAFIGSIDLCSSIRGMLSERQHWDRCSILQRDSGQQHVQQKKIKSLQTRAWKMNWCKKFGRMVRVPFFICVQIDIKSDEYSCNYFVIGEFWDSIYPWLGWDAQDNPPLVVRISPSLSLPTLACSVEQKLIPHI